ncbi:hypothetical protein NFI96_004793 [Prochilodus magdalenae]|nr:hypothetical protein NFI96_004793 [Prochilodus magdalenae]
MHRLLTVLIVFLHYPPGWSNVIQTPDRIFALEDRSAHLTCRHTLGTYYNQMYWYRQEQGSLTRIVYTMVNTKSDFGSFSVEKYSAEKENYVNGSFTVKNLTADDSGVYFCAAASHSEKERWNS